MMKDIFYGLLIVLIIAFFYINSSVKQLENPRFNNGIVIEKGKDLFSGYYLFIKYGNDSIVKKRVYQIFYDKYSVGDTISLTSTK